MRKLLISEQAFQRQGNMLLVITGLLLLVMITVFLFYPTTRKKTLYGVVGKKNQLETYLTKEDLDEIQTWNCQKERCHVLQISDEVYTREDGQKYYFVVLELEIKKEENQEGNYLIYEITKKQTKWEQLKQWIRSVIA